MKCYECDLCGKSVFQDVIQLENGLEYQSEYKRGITYICGDCLRELSLESIRKVTAEISVDKKEYYDKTGKEQISKLEKRIFELENGIMELENSETDKHVAELEWRISELERKETRKGIEQ